MTGKPQSILHAIDTTGPGGAETVFLDLVEKLQLSGYQNYALIKGPGWVEDQLKRRNISYSIVKPHGFLSIPYYIKLFKLIRSKNTRLIHAHLLGSTLTFSILSFFLRIPLVATLHGRVDVNPNERFVAIKNGIMKYGVNRLVAVSRDLAGYIAQRGLFNEKDICVIYNGIEESRYGKSHSRALRESLNIPADALLVGSLGNVRPAKNYEVLIAAAAHLVHDKKLNIHFVVAGHKKPDLMQKLDALMTQQGIADRLHFIGFHDDTAGYLGQLDFFALSSSSEGFSIATIEAMASELPVVATRCGGPEEILQDNVTGHLVAIGEPLALAEKLLYLAQHPAEARAIAVAGRAHAVSVFSFAVMLAAYRKIYAQYL